MKLKIHHIISVAALLLLPAQGRVWTSANDKTKTFEGELLLVKGDKYYIKLSNGKEKEFDKKFFSEDDQKFAAAAAPELEEKAKKAAEMKEKEAKEKAAKEKLAKEAPQSKLAAELKDHLVKLEGKKLVKFAYPAGKEPKFFLVYFSAKW